MDDGDEDAEGDDGEGDDERLYCFCQKQSYGDVRFLVLLCLYNISMVLVQMIACDNEGGCPFEWVSALLLTGRPIVLTPLMTVPSVLCGYEAANARKMVLFCVYNEYVDDDDKEGWHIDGWQKGQEEIGIFLF